MPSEQSATKRLIERGRLAYQVLEFREQAAKYRAAAACLAEAIALAEGGDESKLRTMLESLDSLDSMNHEAWDPREQMLGKPPAPTPIATPAPNGSCDSQPEKKPIVHQKPPEVRSEATLKGANTSHKPAVEHKSVEHKKEPPTNRKDSAPIAKTTKLSAKSQSKVDAKKKWATKRKWRKVGIDMWISMAIHGVLLVILGVWVVVTVQNTPVLSVVAATVESNEVLMETPMESISELETTSMDAADIATPDTSQMQMKVDTDAVSYEKVDLGVESLAQSSSISEQMSRAGAPGNKIAEGAEFFGSKATGNRFVYIVDASPSMRRDRAFDAAKEEIFRSLRSMKPKQRFAILFFGGQVQMLELVPGQRVDQPVNASDENIEKAVQWLQKITIQTDGKPPIEAIKSALDLQPDGIFLLFDGATKLDNWTQVVRKLNTSQGLLSDGGTQVPIHVIHFFREEFQGSMQQLAQENGGTYRFVPRPGVPLFP